MRVAGAEGGDGGAGCEEGGWGGERGGGGPETCLGGKKVVRLLSLSLSLSRLIGMGIGDGGGDGRGGELGHTSVEPLSQSLEQSRRTSFHLELRVRLEFRAIDGFPIVFDHAASPDELLVQLVAV